SVCRLAAVAHFFLTPIAIAAVSLSVVDSTARRGSGKNHCVVYRRVDYLFSIYQLGGNAFASTARLELVRYPPANAWFICALLCALASRFLFNIYSRAGF